MWRTLFHGLEGEEVPLTNFYVISNVLYFTTDSSKVTIPEEGQVLGTVIPNGQSLNARALAALLEHCIFGMCCLLWRFWYWIPAFVTSGGTSRSWWQFWLICQEFIYSWSLPPMRWSESINIALCLSSKNTSCKTTCLHCNKKFLESWKKGAK